MPTGPRHSGMLATTTCVWCVGAFSVVALLSASAAPATAVDVCVSMGSGGQVAGVQMDLAWDATCMTADSSGGSTANCRAEPATRKTIATKVGNGTLRALFFSLADTNPIPDGTLYCCAFTATGTSSDPCCSLRFANVSLSDPVGHRLGAEDAVIQASVGGVQCATAAAGGAAAPPAAPPLAPGAAPPAAIVVSPAGSEVSQPPAGQAPAAPAGPAPASGNRIVTGSEPGTSGAAPAGAAEEAPAPGETRAGPQFTTTVPPRPTRPPQRTPTHAGTPTMPARTPTGERTPSAPGTPTGAPARTPAP